MSIREINDININLKTGKASLEVSSFIGLEKIQKVLPLEYKININDEINSLEENTSKSKIQMLYPLFIIISYVIAGSIFLQKGEFSIINFMYDYIGLYFIVFSFFKFLDYKKFPNAFSKYDPLAMKWFFYGKIFPFIETVLGILFLLRWQLMFALIITLIIMFINTIGVIRKLFEPKPIDCACLGTKFELPMTEVTLIENMIMLIMSISMIYFLINQNI